MEALAIGSRYIDQSEFASLAKNLNCITKVSTFDEFGMYQGCEISENGNSIFNNSVSYKCLEKTENEKTYKQLSHIVESETMVANGVALTTRKYQTDAVGRIIKIEDEKFGNHSYSYDDRGFLVKDDDTAYEYDANGNVTKIGATVLKYDATVRDKLVSVGDKVVSYDATNPLVPTAYDGNTYTFEGRRLLKVQNENQTVEYTYNDQGLRTKKYKTGSGYLSAKYFYEGTKLVAEVSSDRRLDYLYDENDMLFGFVLNQTDTYFYVRDTLENILGIIDSNATLLYNIHTMHGVNS